MSISFNGINNDVKKIQKNIGAKNFPDWEMIPSKGNNTLSKDEMKEQIEELASQEAKANSKTELKAIMLQVEKLRAQYLSTVSPDRKALFKNAINKIGNKQDTRPDTERNKTLVEFLTEKDIKNDATYNIVGGSITATANSFGGYDFEIYAGSEMALRIDTAHNTVSYVKTAKELKLNEEFNRIFFNVKNAGKQDNSFDVKA